MEENIVTPYEYIRMLIEKYGDEIDLNKYDNLIGDYKQLFELAVRLQKENRELRKELNEENKRCMMLAIEKQDYFEKYQYNLKQNESLTREMYHPKQKVEEKIEKLKDEMEKDKMEQFDDYVIYLIEKYLSILEGYYEL